MLLPEEPAQHGAPVCHLLWSQPEWAHTNTFWTRSWRRDARETPGPFSLEEDDEMPLLHTGALKHAIAGPCEDLGQSFQLPLNCFNEQDQAAKPGVKDWGSFILISLEKSSQ